MLITTTFDFAGYRIIEYKGLVRGIIVRAPTIVQGIVGGLKNIIGGRIGAYTEMCEQARQQAYNVMIEHANQMGANAIVGVRYDASDVHSVATEVLCYGTAVVVKKIVTEEERSEMLGKFMRPQAEASAPPQIGSAAHPGVRQIPPPLG